MLENATVTDNYEEWLGWLQGDLQEALAKAKPVQSDSVNASTRPQQCLYSSAKRRLTSLLSSLYGNADTKRRVQEMALESHSLKEFGDLIQSATLGGIFPDPSYQAKLWSAVQEVGDLFCSVKPLMMSAPDTGRLLHKSEMGGPDAFACNLDEGPWYIISSSNPNVILEGPFKNVHAGKNAMHSRLERLLASARENQQEDVPERMAIQKYICGDVMADDAKAELLRLGISSEAIAPLFQKADRLKPKVKINPVLSGLYDGIS